ncbi:hypothetical protein [Glycomyces albidus]|uniref:WD40 repeat domain-containing protein n=1 Tax=Glycomyces albidus TaxID=2656774 RepID=A0A6L5GCM1_9ACTN|nr:hypothetical protein [Glycomyces albidus]MQM27434.1 hypothetical protein [Glycomyces albidus]
MTRTRLMIIAAALALLASCDSAATRNEAADAGVFYGLGDDHRLYRWDPAETTAEPVLDLGGAWDAEGDVGTVLRSSLSIDPRQQSAAWIEGASPSAALKFGDLETGEITTAAVYPVDHACIDPTWLADGSALLVHRAAVWGAESSTALDDTTPLPVQSWGDTEWHSPESGELPATVDLETRGCRLRWYTAEDGSAQAIYHNTDVTELYRVDTVGNVLEIIEIPELDGVEPLTIGLVGVDPTGRYACIVDGYGPYGAFKGGFTTRAQSGTRVIDLQTGEAAGHDGPCTSLHADGYIARDDDAAAFVDYDGRTEWTVELPAAIKESPVLFYYPDERG